MDIELIIIGAILIAICVSPFAYGIYAAKKKNRNMVRILQEIAGKNGHRITRYDHTFRVAIGMDDLAGRIYFYKSEGSYGLQEYVDLDTIESCRVLKEFSGNNGSTQGNIQKLLLNLNLQTSSPKTKSFIFYDTDKDWQLSGEVALADKWSSIINNKIAQRTTS